VSFGADGADGKDHIILGLVEVDFGFVVWVLFSWVKSASVVLRQKPHRQKPPETAFHSILLSFSSPLVSTFTFAAARPQGQ